MSPPYTHPLDPKVLDRLSGLSLVARTVVEGFMAGHHRSPHRGSSVEFAQHRPYVQGDELRHVDWKVFAKSDRLVVKEFVEETNLPCHLLLDASESMAFGSLDWTKFDYARWCAGALAHLILARRDTAGLVIFDGTARHTLPPAGGAAQRRGILDALEEAQPTGPTAIGAVLRGTAGRLSRRGIVAVFSDFLDDVDTITEGLRLLVHGGHEPILFRILDPLETSFDLDRLVRLDGLEATGSQKVAPRAMRDASLEELQAHRSSLARQAQALSIDLIEINTSDALDNVLAAYLARRAARTHGGMSSS